MERGFSHVRHVVQAVRGDLITGHIDAFEVTFLSPAGITLLGALAWLVLVRRTTRIAEGPIFKSSLALDPREHWAHPRDHGTSPEARLRLTSSACAGASSRHGEMLVPSAHSLTEAAGA